uniref:Putative capsid protein n=1 Tax=viral metagenome TaxID=1070528 RepID=A0A6M3MAT2_9ZZZZ
MKKVNISRVYGEASREIRQELRSIDILTFNAEKADDIKKKTRRLTLALDIAAKNWTESELAKQYLLGARRARVALEVLGKKPRGAAGTPTGRLLQDKALETLVKANVSIRRTVGQFLDAALFGAQKVRSAQIQEFDREETLRQFVEMGEEAIVAEISRGELSKKVFDYLLGQIDEEGFIEVNGKFWNPRKYTKLVARTEMRKAQTAATKDICQQYNNDLIQVSDHGTDCEICKEIEGNIYSLSGRDLEYPMLPIDVPAHPNCLHSVIPTSREAVEARRRWS